MKSFSAMIIKAQNSEFKRTIVYETMNRKGFVIIQQEANETFTEGWRNCNDILLPRCVIDFIQVYDIDTRNLSRGFNVEDYPDVMEKQYIHNLMELPDSVRSLCYRYDCGQVEIYTNQQQTWQELSFVDSYWGVQNGRNIFGGIDSPSGSETQTPDSTGEPRLILRKTDEERLLTSGSLVQGH